MASFRNIIDELEIFADKHLQVHSFGWGNPDNITTKDHLFPMLFAAPVPGNVDSGIARLNFDLYLIDLEAQDHSNLLTIMNEMLAVGNDVVSRFFEENDGELFELDETSVRVTPFEAKFDDHTAGWIFNVSLMMRVPTCETDIPLTKPEPPSNIEIKGFLLDSETEFIIDTDGRKVNVTQDGFTKTYKVSGPTTCKAIPGSEVILTFDKTTTNFKFKSDSWKTLEFTRLDNVTSLEYACVSLKRLKEFRFSAATPALVNVNAAWHGCSELREFPYFDSSNVTDFGRAWNSCKALETFPLIDTSSGTTFSQTWQYCDKLNNFPKLNMDKATNLQSTWDRNFAMTVFPHINFPSCTNFHSTWTHCHELHDFPSIDVSAGENFYTTFAACHGIESFPLLDFSSGKIFFQTFSHMENLECFKSLDFSNLNHGHETFKGCDKLVQPAPTGTHVRKGVTGTKGKWTNVTHCP